MCNAGKTSKHAVHWILVEKKHMYHLAGYTVYRHNILNLWTRHDKKYVSQQCTEKNGKHEMPDMQTTGRTSHKMD